MKTYRFFKKIYCARIPIQSARFTPFGFDTVEISFNSSEGISFFKKTYCARILIEGARFPPFGFVIAEISSNLLCPDFERVLGFPPSGSIQRR